MSSWAALVARNVVTESERPNASPTDAVAASSSSSRAPDNPPGPRGKARAYDKWIHQARLSPVSPLTGKVHCLACGKAFDLYSVLAQHVGDKHEGMNSPEANFRAVPAPAARPAPAPAALPSGKRAQVTLGGFLPLLKAPKTGKKPLAAPVTIARSTPAPSKTLQPALRPSAAPAAPPPSTSAAAPAAATATSLRLERTQVYKGRQRAQPRKKKPSKMRRSVLALRKEQRAEQARDRDEAVVRLAAELPPLAAVVRGLQRVEGAQRERVAELQGILTELRARAASLRPAAPPPHEEPSTSATPAPGPVLMSRWADIVLGGKGERASAPSVHVVSVKVHRKANIAASRTALRKRRRAALATCQETTPEASELAALALQVQLTKMKLRVESFKLQHCIAMVAGVRDRARGLFAMLRRAGTRTRKLVRSDLTGVTNADWAALMGRKFRVGMKKEEAGAGDESDTDPSPPPLTDLRAEEAGSRLLDAAAARLTDPTLWTSDDPSSSALRCAACPGAAFASLDLLHAHLASPEHAARAAAVLRSQAATSTPTAAPGLPKSNLKRPPPPRLLPQGALDALLPPPPPPPQIPPDDTHGAMSGGPGDEEEDREEDDMDGDGDDAAGDSSPAVAPEILEASAAGTLERIRPPAEVWGTERPLKKLLHELMRFQRRLVETNPTKAKMRRRFYSGLRECHKWTRIGKVRLLVLARDIEQAPGVGGTLEALHALLRDAGQRGVPVLWCATRERLGFIFGGKRKISSIGIVDASGADEFFKSLLEAQAQQQADPEGTERRAARAQAQAQAATAETAGRNLKKDAERTPTSTQEAQLQGRPGGGAVAESGSERLKRQAQAQAQAQAHASSARQLALLRAAAPVFVPGTAGGAGHG